MIPSAFVTMEALPLMPSGKVDRRHLPAPDQSRPDLDESFVMPRTPLEEEIARIWEQVLKIDRVGVYDNFFALGGHSLIATQVISRLSETLEVDLPLRVIFEQPTVAGVAQAVVQYQTIASEGETTRLLAELALLSDEEAQRLLDSDTLNGREEI
jgi:acyl carrier protein